MPLRCPLAHPVAPHQGACPLCGSDKLSEEMAPSNHDLGPPVNTVEATTDLITATLLSSTLGLEAATPPAGAAHPEVVNRPLALSATASTFVPAQSASKFAPGPDWTSQPAYAVVVERLPPRPSNQKPSTTMMHFPRPSRLVREPVTWVLMGSLLMLLVLTIGHFATVTTVVRGANPGVAAVAV